MEPIDPDTPLAPEAAAGGPDVAHALGALHDHIDRLERMIAPEVALGRSVRREVEHQLVPAWRRATDGEHRVPVALAIVAAIALQVTLPGRLAIQPQWLLPTLEGLLAVGLIVANPRRINRTNTVLRAASVALIALISLANGYASVVLINDLMHGRNSNNASVLLGRGAAVYLTNILVFALWFWEWDRGGPVARAAGTRPHPDFLFPQMASPELAGPDWQPNFVDYLYVSFTNATAFSPTDTMPMSRWAKMLMLVQSAISLVTVGLVVARAINVLK